jgi:hypothetical protein
MINGRSLLLNCTVGLFFLFVQPKLCIDLA